MTGQSRVYGQNVSIDPSAVAAFFSGRARRATSAEPLTSVLYQDGNPELARARDQHEKQLIVPELALSEQDSVLDVGCGIGRWAQPVLDAGAHYCGTDFSDELLHVARTRITHPNARFVTCPIQSLNVETLDQPGGFSRVIVAGVLIYLNDTDLLRALTAVAASAASRCLIYLREPVATGDRLTLDQHWSSDLDQSYSAVYRSEPELLSAFGRTLLATGFTLRTAADLYPADLNNRADTKQRYYLLERGR